MTWGFCVVQDTIYQGLIPIEHDGTGLTIVHPCRAEAERSIAEDSRERLHLYQEGEWAFEEAVTTDEFVVEVEVSPDGTITPVDN